MTGKCGDPVTGTNPLPEEYAKRLIAIISEYDGFCQQAASPEEFKERVDAVRVVEDETMAEMAKHLFSLRQQVCLMEAILMAAEPGYGCDAVRVERIKKVIEGKEAV